MRIVYTVLNGRIAGGQVVCGQFMLAAKQAADEVCRVTPSLGQFTSILEEESVPIVQLPMERTFHLHRAWQFARFLKQSPTPRLEVATKEATICAVLIETNDKTGKATSILPLRIGGCLQPVTLSN